MIYYVYVYLYMYIHLCIYIHAAKARVKLAEGMQRGQRNIPGNHYMHYPAQCPQTA